MKKTTIVLILLGLTIISNGQIIKGTVYDKDTKEPVIAATVYFNGTSEGTLTDANGHFSINASKYSSMPLTISAIGYYSATIKKLSPTKPLEVYLETKVIELDEVNISAKFHSLRRSENLTTFRNEFLGTTANALNCKIMNEDDIIFKTSEDGDTLIALSYKPLIIENKALGYNITYFLDRFEYNKVSKTFLFNGNVIFREDTTLSERRK
ncbi:MAG TPA: carboxypeptidase-like regulatory domain-containing protein, partial [Bacteroidales bacterium]|nr:carboxypeptidase-like regulatory domain-containing protein [Bacteroidales bacterium]